MQLNNDQHIDELMERFFNGETSNVEEQELYRFFARKDIPDRLKKYQSMFGFFETGIANESNSSVNEITTAIKPETKHLTLRRTWLWSGIAAVAASLLLFLFLNKGNFKQDDFNPYEGSYIIRNGVKTAIPEDIARRMDQIIMEADRREREKEQLAMRSVEQKEAKIDRIENVANIYEKK